MGRICKTFKRSCSNAKIEINLNKEVYTVINYMCTLSTVENWGLVVELK